MTIEILGVVKLLFWPVLWLFVFGWAARVAWHQQYNDWKRTFGYLLSLDLFFWVFWVTMTRVYALAAHVQHTEAIWPLYLPLASTLIFVGVFYEAWKRRNLEPTWLSKLLMIGVAVVMAWLLLIVALPRIVGGPTGDTSVKSSKPNTAAMFSWEAYTTNTNAAGFKCLTKVTGVTKAEATSWTKLVKDKKYDPRMLVVINEPSTTVAEAHTQAAAQGVPRATKLPVLHVPAVWAYGSNCKPTLYSHPGVVVSISIPTKPKHPTTSAARKDVGIFPEPLGPLKVASAP